MASAFAYLRDWMPALDRRSLMHCRLSWHVALGALALGHREQAWEAYRSAVHPGAAWGPPLNVVTDAASFLWRAGLAGEPTSTGLWREVHGYALRSFPKAGVAFADVHSLLACAVEGDLETLGVFLDDIRERIRAGKYPPGEVAVWIVEGFSAYAAGDWDDAIGHFRRALPQAVRIGWSRAQRDLVAYSLAAALIHADRPDEARKVMASRPNLAPGPGAASLH